MTTLARINEKKHLSAKGLLSKVRQCFEKVQRPIRCPQGKQPKIALADILMSGLAIFGLKMPSLLQYDRSRKETCIDHNLRTLYGIKTAPSDTYLREQLDDVDPRDVRGGFKAIFSELQRGKALEKFTFMNGKFLMSNDGTGYFSSKKIHCKNCCVKEHRNGTKTYYHMMQGCAIVHPKHKAVIPICPEPIMKADGKTKNDCERNASERLLRDFRREHPHLGIIIVEDALASNAPHLKLLRELKMDYITVVKPEGNKSLFNWILGLEVQKHERVDKNGIKHCYEYINQVPLNDANPEIEVNYVSYTAYEAGEKKYQNTWITNIEVTKANVEKIVLGGRSRWRIENETFNTLKNQGYHFEHNYGHGHKNLSTVMGYLMLLAFLIDQAQQISCGYFQAALKRLGAKIMLWERIRGIFILFRVRTWKDLYRAIIGGDTGAELKFDSS